MRAISTMYGGVHFRSRLEARWAAFFDIMGWPWAYEPIDLSGYIPDFIVTFPAGALLVEVKPALYFEELEEHVSKVEQSGWGCEVLMVGAKLFDSYDRSCAGLLGETHGPTGEPCWWWGKGVLFTCGECGERSIHHEDASYHCRNGGCYDGDGHLGSYDDVGHDWNEAGNAVQWQPRRILTGGRMVDLHGGAP